MSDIAEQFRVALRGVGASVTILSTVLAHRRYGMVATAVMPVTMEPPSLVVGVNRSASIHPALSERGAFVVNALSRWDHAMAKGFAAADGEARFAHGAWSSRRSERAAVDGLPFLVNAQAALLCSVTTACDVGTHTLFVGEVLEVLRTGERTPLVYCDGAYGTVLPLPQPRAPSFARHETERA